MDKEREIARLDAKLKKLKAEKLKCEEALHRGEQAVQTTLETYKSIDELALNVEKGDVLSVGALMAIASRAIFWLNSIVKSHPHQALPFSRKLFAWPAFISHKRAFKKENDDLLRKLELCQGGLFSGRHWQLSAPSTSAAFNVFWFAHSIKQDLPPLIGSQNKKIWFEAGWKGLLQRGCLPEKHLAVLGKSAIGKSAIKRANKRGNGGANRRNEAGRHAS
jgi:hypothetical protein